MIFARTPLILALAAVLSCVCAARAERPARFVAMLADGSRVEGTRLVDWHEAGKMPRVDAQPLLDPGNPIRWLRDRTLQPGATSDAYVETVLGDRMPGTVIGFRPRDDASYEPQPAHFVVSPDATLKPPKAKPDDKQRIRIVERFVRRVVWRQRDVDRYEAGTLFFNDGRTAKFRTAQFGDDFVGLLTADGFRKVFFSEIAELHLPEKDSWDAYFDELAALSPGSGDRLLQIETTSGLTVTASLARFDATVQGNPADSDRWVHGVQPAWSLDMLWIANGDIWMRRSFAPHEVPLSRMPPVKSVESSLISGAGRMWQRDRNVRGGPLFSGDGDFGWGFGVHASSELQFELPKCARSFRSRVGLDRIAGAGGCVRARVFLNSTDGKAAFESDFLVGSAATADTGVVVLPESVEAQRFLVLQIDPVHEDRPPGADPLDIRDMADWFDPLLELDSAIVREEIRHRLPRHFPAWHDWVLSQAEDAATAFTNVSYELPDTPKLFALGTLAAERPLILHRHVKLSESDNWLMLFVSREGNQLGPEIEVRAGGESLFKQPVPQRNAGQPDVPPLVVSLAGLHSAGPLDIEIVQHPGPQPFPVHWRAIRIGEQLPTLYQVFEDRGNFAAVDLPDIDPGERGAAKLYPDDAHSGRRSVQITPRGQFQLKLAETVPIRENPRWGEYRYIRFAFRKSGQGRVCLELNHKKSAEKPVRYDAGMGEPCWGEAKRVWLQQLPNEWIVMTRNLHEDFGELDVTGLTISSPDGDNALFDHVYLARAMSDFEQLPSAPKPDATNEIALRELTQPVIDRLLPATVGIDMGDGRFGTGVLISKEGDILTAGHVIVRPDRDVTILFADGRKVTGKTRGIFRQLNIGLVTITDKGEYPFVRIEKAAEVSADRMYIAAAHRRVIEEAAAPKAAVVDMRRVFLGSIWTTLETDDWCAGGPLIDHEERLVGIHTRASRFGGVLYSRVDQIAELLPRLKNGELWGGWMTDTGPVIDIAIMPVKEGCKVIRIGEDSSAAKAGLMMNDIVTKVEGRSVVSLADIDSIVADKDPGQNISAEVLRGDQTMQVQLTLDPRVP